MNCQNAPTTVFGLFRSDNVRYIRFSKDIQFGNVMHINV